MNLMNHENGQVAVFAVPAHPQLYSHAPINHNLVITCLIISHCAITAFVFVVTNVSHSWSKTCVFLEFCVHISWFSFFLFKYSFFFIVIFSYLLHCKSYLSILISYFHVFSSVLLYPSTATTVQISPLTD